MLLGESDAIQNIRAIIEQLHKNTRLPVLITGESGVGKELVAQAIHFGGPRQSKPFVPVNCGATPSTLWESAFFWPCSRCLHWSDRRIIKAHFETADGGTLFLDEIGDMPIENQVKLLRILDDGVITRIGATESKEVDFRVVAATNAGLSARADAGLFRSRSLQSLGWHDDLDSTAT